MTNTRSLPSAKTVMNEPKYEVKLMPRLEKACGLDLHKDKIVGFISDKEGKEQEMKEFGTFTDDLFQIRDWLFYKKDRSLPDGKHRDLLVRTLQSFNSCRYCSSCFESSTHPPNTEKKNGP
jgi:hypothetical protein